MDDTERTLAVLAKGQFGVFHRSQAEEAGLDRWALSRRLRSGRLERVGAQTYRFGGQIGSWRQLLTAGLLDLGQDAVVGGRAAAALHRFDGFAEGPVEFLVPRDLKDRRSVGVVRSTNALPLIDTCTREGHFRATSPAATIVRLAAHVSEAELKRAVDSAIRDGGTSETFLRRRLAALRGPGRHGSRLLDDVIDGAGGHSFLERRFLQLVAQAALPRPKTQVILRRSGRHVARVDFAWPPGTLIVEVNGHRTHSTREQLQRDEQRRTELTLLGFTVVAFTYDDVIGRPEWVIDQVRLLLARAA
jgi:very-short-patch-repair endonuclease